MILMALKMKNICILNSYKNLTSTLAITLVTSTLNIERRSY